METEQHRPPPNVIPHVIIFPYPAQGHVNSMLKLAELLCLSGFNISFLNTHHNHSSLTRCTDAEDRFRKYPRFNFVTISDGLPEDQPRSGYSVTHLFESMALETKPLFKQLVTQMKPRVSCIIGDGILGFVLDVALELHIPIIHFRTVSACSFWVYHSVPDMIEAGEIPIRGDDDMDRVITKVPGMETLLRCRDLPSFCRVKDIENISLQMMMKETRRSSQAEGLILNTFEDLEGPILSQIRNYCPKVYPIGPLHEFLNTKCKESYRSSNSLRQVDRSCMGWLDAQPPESVLYISFGSVTVMTKDQLMEFWHGIISSKKYFLWVIRPEFITNSNGGNEEVPEQFQEGPKENGYVVKWAPQEEVLAHKAIGGFLTHSGWNSTLESIVCGVPMICWPYFADQQVNSRFVSEVWKLGVDMKDVYDRRIVEKMVNDLMVDKREEFVKSAARMAELAKKSVNEGGSSASNLNRLIQDIRLMCLQRRDN